ncbi:MAG: hypothetical protein LBM25_02790, partial [Bacteroidales bacterium]|nr:hypothetical protein [Bacteroidales bacterium]
MKKTILLISLIIYSNLTFSQVLYDYFIMGSWPPANYNNWLFPEAFQAECATLPFSPEYCENPYNSAANGLVSSVDTVQGAFGMVPRPSNLSAFAQPYFIDSVISIKGVAIIGLYYPTSYIYQIYNCPSDVESPMLDSMYYFQIRDSNFNVLAQVRYDTTKAVMPDSNHWWANLYKELFFDSTIFITASKFYASITVPLHVGNMCMYPPHIASVGTNGYCPVTEFPSGTINDKDWEEFTQLRLNKAGGTASDSINTLCIFPILDTLVYRRDAIVEATNAEYNEITSSMNISIFPLDLGYPLPDSLGVIYIKSDSSLLDINNPLCNIISSTFISGQGVYNYEISFDSIICDTTYFFKPFIVNSNGIIYGQVDSFKKQCFNSGLIDANNNENKIKIHPNPAKDYI